MKLPAFQFYVGDWLKDPALSKCSPATRGIWIDALCAMHEMDRSGQLVGSLEEISRICRCRVADLSAAVRELHSTGTADVAFDPPLVTVGVTKWNGIVTLTNRRQRREWHNRQLSKARVDKWRGRNGSEARAGPGNAAVTSYSSSSASAKKIPRPLSGDQYSNRPCEYCGATEEKVGFLHEPDHFIPRSRGGSDDPENIVLACHRCNQAKQGRLFKTIEECRQWLHRAYWNTNRKRWIEHRPFAFGGKPPGDYVPPYKPSEVGLSDSPPFTPEEKERIAQGQRERKEADDAAKAAGIRKKKPMERTHVDKLWLETYEREMGSHGT